MKVVSHSPRTRCCLAAIALLASAIAPAASAAGARAIVVSVAEQKLALVDGGNTVAEYSISTSKFGVGDRCGSYGTPTGALEVASKIGANAPVGAVFKSRVQTGEVLRPNAPGRDPIVTRILWLRGLESANARAYERGIYIHGTPEERNIGRPASYGCIRMRSRDVVELFNAVPVGTRIEVTKGSLRSGIAEVTAMLGGVRVAAN